MRKRVVMEPAHPQVVTSTYETEIEYTCPVRGKVKQKVQVKRLASIAAPPEVEDTLPTQNATVKLEEKFSGLHLTDDSLDEEPAAAEEPDDGYVH